MRLAETSEPSGDMWQLKSAQESKIPDIPIRKYKRNKKPEKAGSEVFKTTQ